MSEFSETTPEVPGPEATAKRRGRLVAALLLGVILLAAGMFFLIVLPSRETPSTEQREVRTSAPNQVSAPDGRLREAKGLLKVGDRLPSFALPDLSGRMTSSSEFLGKPLVLNVWASWCPPCIKEMPALKALHARAGEDFRLISISVDEDLPKARALAQKHDLDFLVLLDPTGDLPAKFGTVMYPETWIFNAEGRLIERIIGERDWADPAVARKIAAGVPTGWGS